MENWFPSTLVKDTIHQIRWVADAFCLPVTVAFSGGKDSIVLLDLVRKSGVYHSAHYHVTTVDPPELIYFIRKNYPGVIFDRPKKTMWELIVANRWPPLRGKGRFCCSSLKERSSRGLVMTGVRKDESTNRKGHFIFWLLSRWEVKYKPIFNWSEGAVWQYIADNKLQYPSLYDEGFDRIGCIGCPQGGEKQMTMQFDRYPKFKAAYIRAFDKAIQNGQHRWKTGQEMFNWWMRQ